eukprot:CAMPEP_0202860350 /NCGR_PEP_ID=MMETSP1391-20130828/2092_1 /ASSEMBLY_ACC=CAM_ASM_000867 /TAXON_ID=1034604 /ORGANISM="Chlamydomonas leiostraca, Strain SAG 11-49" /LENGTH=339 /DNA_ID=CAMNT_0049539505 /DNA_START=64 /DNA_END=1079 /DNA_ORIENTATION=-
MSGEDGQPAVVKVTAEQLGLQLGEEYAGQLDIDLGHLTAWDPAPIDAAKYQGEGREEACLETARAITQSLVNRLFDLPSEPITGGRLAQLPFPTTVLPRQRPLPKMKELTRWQKFAQKKGIVKKKRSKMEWDETNQEWRRRHGYKRVNDDADVPIIEASAGDKPGEDPFARLAREKRERVSRNKKSQLENAKVAAKSGALPATLKLAAVLTDSGQVSKAGGARAVPKGKRKELKEEIKLASRLSGVSTASMGKFDRKLKGEKPGERAPLGKRRQFAAVTDTAGERAKMGGLADRFIRERADDILDVKKAIGKFEAEAREERRAAKEVIYAAAAKKAGKG